MAGGETRRWQHNVGGRRRGARVVVECRWNSCRERDIVQSEQQLAGVAWPEARRDGGITTLVEEEGGSRGGVTRIVAERERLRRCSARKEEEEGFTVLCPN